MLKTVLCNLILVLVYVFSGESQAINVKGVMKTLSTGENV